MKPQKLRKLKAVKFAIDGDSTLDVFEGFDSGHRWNGWFVPLVTKTTKAKILKWHKANLDADEDPEEMFNEVCDFSATESDQHGLFMHNIGYCWMVVSEEGVRDV
tara:strand:+ start:3922 stop:4236 length:315 start_codon:yes stop_codon:yes gene_type:complete